MQSIFDAPTPRSSCENRGYCDSVAGFSPPWVHRCPIVGHHALGRRTLNECRIARLKFSTQSMATSRASSAEKAIVLGHGSNFLPHTVHSPGTGEPEPQHHSDSTHRAWNLKSHQLFSATRPTQSQTPPLSSSPTTQQISISSRTLHGDPLQDPLVPAGIA